MNKFTFAVTLTCPISVDAHDLEAARAVLAQHINGAEANLGAWPNGDPILTEVAMVNVTQISDQDNDDCWKCGESGGTSCGDPFCGLLVSEPEETGVAAAPKIAPDLMAVARTIGEVGSPHIEGERLLFESYMKGHCWDAGPWDATKNEYLGMFGRTHYAVWRARAALTATFVQPAAKVADMKTFTADTVSKLDPTTPEFWLAKGMTQEAAECEAKYRKVRAEVKAAFGRLLTAKAPEPTLPAAIAAAPKEPK